MINLPRSFGERNLSRLGQMFEQVEIHRRGLGAIKVDMASYSSSVVALLMNKIPEAIRLNMIRFNEKDQLECK